MSATRSPYEVLGIPPRPGVGRALLVIGGVFVASAVVAALYVTVLVGLTLSIAIAQGKLTLDGSDGIPWGSSAGQPAESFYDRGSAFLEDGDYESAIELDPELAEAYLRRGHVYVALGEKEKARADYKQSLTLAGQQGESEVEKEATEALVKLN